MLLFFYYLIVRSAIKAGYVTELKTEAVLIIGAVDYVGIMFIIEVSAKAWMT